MLKGTVKQNIGLGEKCGKITQKMQLMLKMYISTYIMYNVHILVMLVMYNVTVVNTGNA